jgi:hypothetical protein
MELANIDIFSNHLFCEWRGQALERLGIGWSHPSLAWKDPKGREIPDEFDATRRSLCDVTGGTRGIGWEKLLSDASDGVSDRRFNASLWDDSKDGDDAARAAMLPYPEEPNLASKA